MKDEVPIECALDSLRDHGMLRTESRLPSEHVNLANFPYRSVPYPPPRVDVEKRADGALILRSPHALEPPGVRTISEFLPRWALERPEVPMLCQRGPDGAWRKITWSEMWRAVRSLGSALLPLECSAERPLMILSGNSIEFAALKLAADYAGFPIAPVSPAYSLLSTDFARLKGVRDLIAPGAVFVQDAKLYAKALAVLGLAPERVIAVRLGESANLRYADLASAPESGALEAAHAKITPQSVARYYFTSGSTGVPKGVPNTHRMLVCAQAMSAQLYQGDPARVRVYLDWLPWHHAYGGVAHFHRLLGQGATHYIDEGRPLPGQFDTTLRNLREVTPTSLSNVPAAHAMLAGEMERDPELARRLLASVESLAYGGASLSRDVWERIERLSVRISGEKIAFLTGYGSTETSAAGVGCSWGSDELGNIGVPIPGCVIKLVPVEGSDRYEVRMLGPHVFPGYLKRPDLTAAAFDEEGFYSMGDAAQLVDADAPAKGMRFAGRLAEDFKLSSGSWVQTGSMRLAALALCSPLLRDAVICGHDRDWISVLAWPDEKACRALDPALAGIPLAGLVRDPRVIAALRSRLAAAARGHATQRVERLMLMAEPPSIDANEIADKGYVNQSATRARRAALVEEIYRDPPPGYVACATTREPA